MIDSMVYTPAKLKKHKKKQAALLAAAKLILKDIDKLVTCKHYNPDCPNCHYNLLKGYLSEYVIDLKYE